jgi:hypothetical protein
MIIKEKIEREINFSSEEVEIIKKFRDFLSDIPQDDWEKLGDEFSSSGFPTGEDALAALFDLVDDFYIFAKVN